MVFTSLDFGIFFLLVFIGYWFIFNTTVKLQNGFLLLASYFFYSFWDWRFLFLLLFSTAVNYGFGLAISNAHNLKKRKLLLILIICINAGVLAYFKYFNFFIENFISFFSLLGTKANLSTISIILPLGISFYTFQNISYVTDVYRKHSEPVTNYLSFSVFIAFFPQLISGPIERTNHLMPQVANKRGFNYPLAVNGMRMVLLGLFEKIVIADNCALVVNSIYSVFEQQTGSTLFFNAVLYSFQIYGDFSGYSHIAIGCAALLGFTLRDNFNYPYLAKNIADFWRRWHISFSNWLRDYIYVPLGGSKKGQLYQMRNLAIVFIFSGIWHGANWTFVIYGCIHALLYIIYILYRKKLNPKKSTIVGDLFAMCATFTVLTLARVFFRSESVEKSLRYLEIIFSGSLFTKPAVSRLMLALLFIFLFVEWVQKERQHILDITFIKQRWVRYCIYLSVFGAVIYYAGQSQSFVYFKF